MDSKTCDVKTCETTMLATEATVVRIGNKEYDLCKDCAVIFSKWLEETFSSGRDVLVDVPVNIPWTIATGTSDYSGNVPHWPLNGQPFYIEKFTPTQPNKFTWTATDPKDMNSNWFNCSLNYNEKGKL